jgi:hypothetical protein
MFRLPGTDYECTCKKPYGHKPPCMMQAIEESVRFQVIWVNDLSSFSSVWGCRNHPGDDKTMFVYNYCDSCSLFDHDKECAQYRKVYNAQRFIEDETGARRDAFNGRKLK